MTRLWKWYFNWGKNEFEKMCDRIEACNKRKNCNFNPVICVQPFVKEYVNGDKSRLLRIKAEANSGSYTEFIMNIVTMTGMDVAIFGIIGSLFANVVGLKEYILTAIIILMVLWVINWVKFKNVIDWQKYIIVTIEELETEMKEKGKTNPL